MHFNCAAFSLECFSIKLLLTKNGFVLARQFKLWRILVLWFHLFHNGNLKCNPFSRFLAVLPLSYVVVALFKRACTRGITCCNNTVDTNFHALCCNYVFVLIPHSRCESYILTTAVSCSMLLTSDYPAVWFGWIRKCHVGKTVWTRLSQHFTWVSSPTRNSKILSRFVLVHTPHT